ncbi:MAG: hypothetical protein H6Q74_1404 [Firmicutes bacterium]|nr:hypothetical protein [Bacillota bacterium]
MIRLDWTTKRMVRHSFTTECSLRLSLCDKQQKELEAMLDDIIIENKAAFLELAK